MNHLLGQVIDAKVRLLSLIGEGGMGAVFRGRQLNLDRDVALKLLKPQFSHDEDLIRRFAREARSAGSLRSRHVVKVFDHGTSREGAYIVMELCTGVPLSDLLQLERRLPWTRAVPIVAQILSGLAEAHAKGIVHRDLKSDNVMIERDYADRDFALILDFGIAKLQGSQSIYTAVGSVFGTPTYMAPEQCKGEVADARTDLYAMGVLLFEMLAGTPPFSPELRPTDLLLAHIEEPPPPLALLCPEAPAPLAELVGRLLAKRREDRPPSAEAVMRALLAQMEGQAPSTAAELGAFEVTIPDFGHTPAPPRRLQTEADLPPVQEDSIAVLGSDSPTEMSLSPEEWRVLARLGEGLDVRALAEAAQVSLAWLKEVLRALAAKGVVRLEPPPPAQPPVPEERIELVARVLTETLGPVAPVVVQKTMAQLVREGAALMEDQLEPLLERLALRIQDPGKRRGFLGRVREALARGAP